MNMIEFVRMNNEIFVCTVLLVHNVNMNTSFSIT
jgi:hypothetical protein